MISSEPEADGKNIIIHLRETDGIEAELNLINGLNGNKLKITEVDVTGKELSATVQKIGPLESKFFRITTGL